MNQSDPLFDVSKLRVLVSGGTRGIGRAIAEAFAARGGRVVITGRDQTAANEAAAEMTGTANRVQGLGCDVANHTEIAAMLDEAFALYDGCDVLFNVAGINNRKRVETYSPDEFDAICRTNLRGAFLVAQEFGKRFLAMNDPEKVGSIINIDSLSSHATLPGVTPYAMTKSAMKAMTRGMAIEWSGRGLRVNGIAPGFIVTDLTTKLWSDPGMQAWGNANIPTGRLGQPDDLIGAAVFLASRASTYLTGQTIYIDGGLTAGIHWPIPLPDPNV
jgi:gluconate 5-dehydrogenase